MSSGLNVRPRTEPWLQSRTRAAFARSVAVGDAVPRVDGAGATACVPPVHAATMGNAVSMMMDKREIRAPTAVVRRMRIEGAIDLPRGCERAIFAPPGGGNEVSRVGSGIFAEGLSANCPAIPFGEAAHPAGGGVRSGP